MIDPLSEAMLELAVAPDNLLVGSPELLNVEDAHLDVNTDGLLDASDIDSWYEGLIAADVNGDGDVVSYEYEIRRDVNRDGIVNVLDVSLLRSGIAERVSELGSMLVWRGEVVNPGTSPVYFNGALVISNYNVGFAMADAQPWVPGEEGEGEEECPSVLESDTGWSPLVCVDGEWNNLQAPVCGVNVLWRETVSVCPATYNPASLEMPCGDNGQHTLALQVQQTTTSSVSLTAGVKIDNVFNFGITWGTAGTTTTTLINSSTWTSDPDRNEKVWKRFLKYTATYTLDSMINTPECPRVVNTESDTIFTVSSQTRNRIKTCPGCPQ